MPALLLELAQAPLLQEKPQQAQSLLLCSAGEQEQPLEQTLAPWEPLQQPQPLLRLLTHSQVQLQV